MKDGWDGYQGLAPTTEALKTAALLVFTPMSNGGILIELHGNEGSADISINEYGNIDCVSFTPDVPKRGKTPE